MMATNRRALALALIVAAAPLCGGCQSDNDSLMVAESPKSSTPGGPPQEAAGPATGIKAIMRTVAAGPNSLNGKLGGQLKTDSPDWGTIQGETKEYATLAKELGTHEPPKGSKESWKELTEAFAGHASELEKAAQAKDKSAALTAHDQLSNSCKACHAEHQPPRGAEMRGGTPAGMPSDYPKPVGQGGAKSAPGAPPAGAGGPAPGGAPPGAGTPPSGGTPK